MEYQGKDREKRIWWVRLYLEDYYALTTLLENAPSRDLTIYADEFQLAHAREIEQLDRPTIRKLRLSAGWNIHISIDGSSAFVRARAKETAESGMFLEAVDILERCRLPRRFLFNWYVGFAAFFGGLVADRIVGIPIWLSILSHIFMFVAVVVYLLSLASDRWKGPVLVIARRKERRSFWEAKKHDLAEKLIVALFAGALGYLIRALTEAKK